MRFCIVDRRIYIPRARIIELCNILFCTTARFIDPIGGEGRGGREWNEWTGETEGYRFPLLPLVDMLVSEQTY